MIEAFYNAFLPPSADVCGRRLDQFTVWHHFVLEAVGSPVVTGGENITPVDLLVAVRVCRLKYGGPRRLSPGLRDFLWRRRMVRNPELFKREAKRFYAWLEGSAAAPNYWQRRSSGGEQTVYSSEYTPQSLALVCSLMARAGLSRADAWNTPIGEARWLDAQLARLEGVDLHFLPDGAQRDPADYTEEEILEILKNDLKDPEKVRKAFDHWLQNTKRG